MVLAVVGRKGSANCDFLRGMAGHCDGVGGFYVRIPILLHTRMRESHIGGTYVHSAGHAYIFVISGVEFFCLCSFLSDISGMG